MFRQARNVARPDLDEKLTEKFNYAQSLMDSGNKQEAVKVLEELRKETKKGMIYLQSTHILAFLALEENQAKKAYEYLLSIQDKLSQEAICILHNLAFEENNYELVKRLSSSCYKILPSEKNALINARTFALLGEARQAAGWLKTAMQFGNLNKEAILSENYFKEVKNSPQFMKYFK
jgi:predicted Zn-dependent protease